VTFSDPKVARAVNDRFVPVWFNRGRGFHNCERRTEKWIFESSGEAYPTKNICTFFMTPDFEVLYYVSGYFAPELFLEILEAAGELKDARGAEFGRRHLQFSTRLAERLARARKSPAVDVPSYRDLQHRHGPGCAHAVEEGLRYRKTVHDVLAASGPVPFEKVQHAYLFGNSFTEEIRRPETRAGDFARPQTPTGGSR
jgi:hypothetical protein